MADAYPDFYKNIPGSTVDLKKSDNNARPNDYIGRHVVVVGTAEDGPVMEKVTANSYDSARRIFGSYIDKETGTKNGATLMLGYQRAKAAGADNIGLLRVSGQHAEGEINLNSLKKDIHRMTRENVGEMPGNDQTTVNLPLSDPATGAFDYSYIDSITVKANGIALEGETSLNNNADFYIDFLSGESILYENKVDALANLEYIYDEIKASKVAVTNETLTNVVGTDRYQFANKNIQNITQAEADADIADNLETLVVTDLGNTTTLTIGTDYQMDWEDGYLVLNGYTPAGDLEATSYTYENIIEEEKGKTHTATAAGSDATFALDHLVDITSEVIVEADTTKLDEGSDYEISFSDDGSGNIIASLIAKPGDISMGADLYVSYYFNEEKLYEPKIDMRSVYGSDLYNDVIIRVEDKLVMVNDSYTSDVGSNETLEKLSSTKAKFKNRYVVPGSINQLKLARGGTTSEVVLDLSTDVNINYAQGIVELTNNVMNASDSLVAVFADVSNPAYSFYNVNGKLLTIQKPAAKSTDDVSTLQFDLGSDVRTLGQLEEKVNNHLQNNVVNFNVDAEELNLAAVEIKTPDTKLDGSGNVIPAIYRLSGGDDGLNIDKEELYQLLEGQYDSEGNQIKPGAYDVLMTYEDIEAVVIMGAYADDELADTEKNFAQQLANFLGKSFFYNNEIRGFIGVKPLSNPTRINVIDRANRLLKIENDYFMKDENGSLVRDQDGNAIDVGRFMSIVAHDKYYDDPGLNTLTIENGAAAYAGMASMLANDNSPTNELVTGGNLPYVYSTNQANKLIGNKFVIFKDKNGRPFVTSGVTCGIEGEGWTRYLTVDIVFDLMDDLRRLYDRYYGKGNSLERRNSLNTAVGKELNRDTLFDSEYKLIMDNSDNVIKRMIVDLDITPIEEMQKIHTVLSINREA